MKYLVSNIRYTKFTQNSELTKQEEYNLHI